MRASAFFSPAEIVNFYSRQFMIRECQLREGIIHKFHVKQTGALSDEVHKIFISLPSISLQDIVLEFLFVSFKRLLDTIFLRFVQRKFSI